MRNSMVLSSLLVIGICGAQAARADACNGFSASANLVSNCGFETGNFTGWTGTATTAGINYAGIDSGDFYTSQPTPYSGTYEAYLASLGGTIALTQTINTTAGTKYLIEFALLNDTSASTGYTNSFSALFGGNTLFSETAVNAGPYTLFTYTGVATGSTTDLSFLSRNDGGDFELDSVSATVLTPEPSSILLLATGVAGMAGFVRRRFNS